MSTDEKTGIQALERAAPPLPLKPGLVERPEYEYIRHGTQCLIANFNVATGEIIAPSIGATRTEEDFAAPIAQTIATDPEAPWIFIVDQLNIHPSATCRSWAGTTCPTRASSRRADHRARPPARARPRRRRHAARPDGRPARRDPPGALSAPGRPPPELSAPRARRRKDPMRDPDHVEWNPAPASRAAFPAGPCCGSACRRSPRPLPACSAGARAGRQARRPPHRQARGAEVVTDPARFPRASRRPRSSPSWSRRASSRPSQERIGQDPLVVKPLREIGKYGGTWRRGFTGPSDTSNGHRAAQNDKLLYLDYTGTKIVPNIARGWEVSPDGKITTLLRARDEVERRPAVHRRRLRVLVRGRLPEQGPGADPAPGHDHQRQAHHA